MFNITAAANNCSTHLQRCTVYAFVFPIDESHTCTPIPMVTCHILITVLIISNYLLITSLHIYIYTYISCTIPSEGSDYYKIHLRCLHSMYIDTMYQCMSINVCMSNNICQSTILPMTGNNSVGSRATI